VQASTKYNLASLRASRRCPLLAQSGHALVHCKSPLSVVKRTCGFAVLLHPCWVSMPIIAAGPSGLIYLRSKDGTGPPKVALKPEGCGITLVRRVT
jgi:hypothetical protein